MLMRLPSRPGSAECDSSRLEKGAVPGRARMQRWLHAAQRGPAALGEGRNVLASAESSPSKSLARCRRSGGRNIHSACLFAVRATLERRCGLLDQVVAPGVGSCVQ